MSSKLMTTKYASRALRRCSKRRSSRANIANRGVRRRVLGGAPDKIRTCDLCLRRAALYRAEDGAEGRKDRYVMLSPHLPELLRAWYKAARPQGWLFPGQDRVNSLSTGQLTRACHAAAHMAELTKRVSLHTLGHSFATHLEPNPRSRRFDRET